MPSPERQEGERKQEHEPTPYYKAARFPGGEKPAGRAYSKAQDAIFRANGSELSAYRLILDQLWHVAVLGEPPPEDLERKITKILATGEPATLPPEILKLLQERRAQT